MPRPGSWDEFSCTHTPKVKDHVDINMLMVVVVTDDDNSNPDPGSKPAREEIQR